MKRDPFHLISTKWKAIVLFVKIWQQSYKKLFYLSRCEFNTGEKISKNTKLELIMKHQAVIDFCVCLGKSLTETNYLIQQAYATDVMTRSKVFKWCKEFCDGRNTNEHVEGLSHSQRVKTEIMVTEVDRQNKSNWEIGEMRAPNISRNKGLFLRIVLDAVRGVSEVSTIFRYLILV